MILTLIFFMSPEEILLFARNLEKEGDYFRAITEYKRYLYYNDVDSIRYRIVNIYIREGDYGNALNIMNEIKERDKDYYNIKGWIFYKADLLDSAKKYWDDKKRGLILIKEGKCNDGINVLNVQEKCPTYKNPYVGSLLSMIIPGSGRMYAGRFGDGIFSLVTIISTGYSAYYYYKKDYYIVAGILAGVTGVFYAGEIFGSFVSVKIYNNRLKLEFLNKLENSIEW